MSREIVLLSELKKNKNNEKENRFFPNYCKIYVSIKVAAKDNFAKNTLTHNEHFHIKKLHKNVMMRKW